MSRFSENENEGKLTNLWLMVLASVMVLCVLAILLVFFFSRSPL